MNSGQLRKRYYYWIVPINKQSYESTGFSELVDQYFDSEESPVWYEDVRAVNVKSGGYALAACSKFHSILELLKYDKEVSEEDVKLYLKQALELLKAKKFNEIEKLAEVIEATR